MRLGPFVGPYARVKTSPINIPRDGPGNRILVPTLPEHFRALGLPVPDYIVDFGVKPTGNGHTIEPVRDELGYGALTRDAPDNPDAIKYQHGFPGWRDRFTFHDFDAEPNTHPSENMFESRSDTHQAVLVYMAIEDISTLRRIFRISWSGHAVRGGSGSGPRYRDNLIAEDIETGGSDSDHEGVVFPLLLTINPDEGVGSILSHIGKGTGALEEDADSSGSLRFPGNGDHITKYWWRKLSIWNDISAKDLADAGLMNETLLTLLGWNPSYA